MDEKKMEESSPIESNNQLLNHNSQEFSNDQLKIKAEFQKHCKVNLLIEASPIVVQEAKKKAAKSVGKEVTIAGFRKGKAPLHLIEVQYSKQIETELERTLAIEVFQQSKALTNIPLLNNEPRIGYNTKSITADGAKILVSFETEPTIPSIDFEQITLTKIPRPPVNNETIHETIRQFQFFSTKWETVENREVQENDFVTLDVDIIEETPHRRLFADTRFEVTDRSMAPWMKQLVLHHHTGEAIEGVSAVEETASEADKENFSPKKVLITIKKIETTQLPEVDDTFAQTIGVASAATLRTNVENLLNKKADRHVQEQLREQVAEYLLQNYPFEIPMSLVEKEVRFRMEYFIKDPEYARNWQKMTAEARKQTFAVVSDQASKALRLFYLCKKILSEAKISISPKEITENSQDPIEAIFSENKRGKTSTEEAFSQLLLEKTEDFIISKAKIS